MLNLKFPTVEVHPKIKLVLKHIMRGIKVVLKLLKLGDLKAQVTGKVIGSQLERDLLKSFLLVYLYRNLQVQFV